MPNRQPENVKESFFQALGQSIGALPGIFAQQQQQAMEMLNFQMQQQLFDLKKKDLTNQVDISTAKAKEVLRQSNMTPQELAAEKASAKVTETINELLPFTGAMGGVINALPLTPEQQLLPIISNLNLPQGARVNTPLLDIQNVSPSSKFPTENELILGLFGEEGLRKKLDPFAEKEPTRADLRQGRKDTDARKRNSVLAKANTLYQQLPRDIRAKIKVGSIDKIEDLDKALLSEDIEKKGKKRTIFGIEELVPDIFDREGVSDVYRQLQDLSREYRAIGTVDTLLKSNTTSVSDDELDAELKRRGLIK